MKLQQDEIALLLEENKDCELLKIHAKLGWLNDELFDDYEPRAYSDFLHRLSDWLSNVADAADKLTLFKLAGEVFFVGRAQMASLFRTAFNDNISRWVIDQAELRLDDPALPAELADHMRGTWICPVTDSMRINKFLKVNDLEGHVYRPDWFSMAEFGDQERIRRYVESTTIKRLVLLEDFVGSGRQIRTAIDFAMQSLPNIPILVVPLICCPDGALRTRKLASKRELLTFDPVLELPESVFIRRLSREDEPTLHSEIRGLTDRLGGRLPTMWADEFGYNDIGSLIVLHSNCPDNSLPLLHDDGEKWKALFPRVRREVP